MDLKMDIELNAHKEEIEDNIYMLLKETIEVDKRLDEGLIDNYSYETRMTFLKKQISKTQKKLDRLD
jgi:hypothetical protein